MEKGNLSNTPIPRIALIFEGALGLMTTEEWRDHDKLVAKGRYDEAVAMWHLWPLMMHKIWSLVMMSVNLDVITFAGGEAYEAYGPALARRLEDAEDLPIQRTWATTVPLLARKIAYMPDLVRIYDPDEKRIFTWGGKGFLLLDVNELGS